MLWTEKRTEKKWKKAGCRRSMPACVCIRKQIQGNGGIGNKKETVSLKIHKISGILDKMEK